MQPASPEPSGVIRHLKTDILTGRFAWQADTSPGSLQDSESYHREPALVASLAGTTTTATTTSHRNQRMLNLQAVSGRENGHSHRLIRVGFGHFSRQTCGTGAKNGKSSPHAPRRKSGLIKPADLQVYRRSPGVSLILPF